MNDKPDYEQLEKRVRALEQALKTSEQHLSQIINFLPDATFAIDTQGKVIAWNLAIQKMTGIKARDMLGKGNYEYAIPFYGDRRPVLVDLVGRWDEEFQKKYRYVKKDGDSLVSETYDPLVKPGGYLWNKASLLHGSDGQIIGAIESIRDITERKQMETERVNYKRFLESIYNSSIDGIVSTDLHGTVLFSSPGLCEITGYEGKEVLGKKAWLFYQKGKEDARNIMKGLQEKGKLHNYDFKMKKKDGGLADVILSISYIRNEQGEIDGTLGIFKDVTEKKLLEEELQQVRKTESIATLAGGVAHEFNNILMGITGNIELLQLEMDEKGKKNKRLDLIKNSALRMANLTKQLLAYAKGGKYRPKVISLNMFLEETLPFQKQTIAPTTTLETDLQKNIPHVKVDSGQMQMVLSAILANADEAVNEDGRIKITTRSEKVDKEFIKNHRDFAPGPYVTLTIEDHGKGMDEETLSRLFDPFFTTKFQGRGLGMAAVYGIIRNHQGAIFVDSKQGEGTVVRIYLPAVEVAPEEPKTLSGKLGTRTGNILLIEDEAMLIEITQTLLERLGYRVIVAATGKDAVHTARTFSGDIDLALLDIKLPDMEGGKVYPLLMEARPDLKVIVCSGYSMDGPAREILNAGAQDFMQKPFTLATLRSKLDKVLKNNLRRRS